MKHPLVTNPIRLTAVVIVAVIAAYVMYMGYRLTEVLASPGWCRTALGAEKVSATDGTIKGLDACVSLLTIQLKSLAVDSHINAGVAGLCLLVLIVIVIAGARLEASVSREGGSVNIAPKDAVEAADQTAAAAVDKADEIKGAVS